MSGSQFIANALRRLWRAPSGFGLQIRRETDSRSLSPVRLEAAFADGFRLWLDYYSRLTRMRRSLIITVCLGLFLVILPVVVGLCFARVDSFYHFQGEPQIADPPITVSFRPIYCRSTGQRSSIPGALAPNEKANGFQVEWMSGGSKDFKRMLMIKDIKATLISDGLSTPLDVPFSYWYGEFTASKNIFYAFLSTGGYPADLPLGAYHIRLTYTANDVPHSGEVWLNYVVDRRLGFHTFSTQNGFNKSHPAQEGARLEHCRSSWIIAWLGWRSSQFRIVMNLSSSMARESLRQGYHSASEIYLTRSSDFCRSLPTGR